MSNSFSLTGKLISRSNTEQINDTFKKREFVIEVHDGAYVQHVKFQLTQNNVEKISKFNKNDEIEVTFNIRGREYEKDGKTFYFNNLEAWKVEAAVEQPRQEPAPVTAQPIAAAADDDLPF